ncbi:bifunctional [glutamine synthetase] adenylyltransferase/[glutamine synthetase]-adenylyl-L-tyrosine phosphorylase [Methylobacterium sp. J-068]|uniref:bifunctional [glutamine synthetase] adenylyltransferase/[glutamine synthetase]-adenylyl-L-tyrosine phosphorylase n=1 Tax=Methylobacterium sp. J-068 TaxID=2836649 RepID=UPI001FB9C0C2|nr:bifunctional [glutamine synthetase] adenylyltransferase/[glutamine synthetase]-adenylyl-L-tyrosine phosphorylase [Methylobacterium sp. J-068]MCJ2032673.1 bifunctional [glutamine synthetase] adenylyltransferase/[glutamine synthetase]-adenylyl-L-tyrosine phosphorylase [Methylobacterium sp. J-068]
MVQGGSTRNGSLRARLSAAPVLSDPEGAAARLHDIGSDLPDGFLDERVRALLLGLADHSPFLWQLVAREPARLVALIDAEPEAAHAAIVARQRKAGREADHEDIAKNLRRNRAEHALLVALADIGGLWPLATVTAALSDFADASVGAAADAMLLQAAAAGRFLPRDPDDPQAASGLVVLALGKHGAGELNYSSDIDLVVFFDPEAAPLKAELPATPFFTKLAQGMAKLLQERTADGYVHRVDYRLRPDPGSTPAALSLNAAYVYYENLGQNWERAAYIKARAISGDIPAGEAFLANLRPFVWRKYFDFASIADVHAMKRQIHAVRGHDTIAVAGHDIKLGRGGIREIEFFVQTQQLVFGGRRPELRGRRTVAMLEGLTQDGWIDAAARDDLTAAYDFLRTIEHRLQMLRDEQTQRLPHEPEDLERFARFAGFVDRSAFESALLHHARRVQGHYALLFEAEPDLSSDVGDLVFSGTGDDPATLGTLRKLGFREPERAVETVRGWHFGRRPAVRTPRAREVLTELVPALMQALGGTAHPDAALDTLDRAFGRMPAALELLTILRSNERLRLLFADLLGTAPRLAETVAFSPHVLDAVIDRDFADTATDAEGLAAQFRARLGQPTDHEDFLDRSRDAARQLRFLTGARLLSGILSPAEAGRAFAGIADAVVAVTVERVAAAFFAEHGAVPGGRFAVLALGRLGARQLTADSDLDLVLVYDFHAADRMSAGPKPLDAAVAYNRLAQRIVAALTVPTRRGHLYEVDLRLRPGGDQGPVAVQWRGFRTYQAEEAEPWEHMALTRARVVAGEPSLAVDLADAVRAVVRRARAPAEIYAAVREMRLLVEREKGFRGPLDLKLAPGGLLDLDFLAQALVLAHAHRCPDLVGLDACAVFARGADHALLGKAEADSLSETYRRFDAVLHWQRLMVEGDPAEASPVALSRLAVAMGAPDAERLVSELDEQRMGVRTLFVALLTDRL